MRRSLKKRQNGIIVIMLAVLALFAVLFTRSLALREERAELQRKLADLEAEYETETERTVELEEKRAYMSTIDYIEEIAREKLGLVFKNEVIFREEDEDSKQDN